MFNCKPELLLQLYRRHLDGLLATTDFHCSTAVWQNTRCLATEEIVQKSFEEQRFLKYSVMQYVAYVQTLYLEVSILPKSNL